MCGGGPPPGTSCDSTALTTPSVSRPWMRMTIGMPKTFIFLPPSDGIWIGFIDIGGDGLRSCANWQVSTADRSADCGLYQLNDQSAQPQFTSFPAMQMRRMHRHIRFAGRAYCRWTPRPHIGGR